MLTLANTFPQEEPKKFRFDYDLFLHLEGHPPVNHLRCEKLTFNNPTEEFRRKLLRAGGVGERGEAGVGQSWSRRPGMAPEHFKRNLEFCSFLNMFLLFPVMSTSEPNHTHETQTWTFVHVSLTSHKPRNIFT